jgi:hypothetical protein
MRAADAEEFIGACVQTIAALRYAARDKSTTEVIDHA